MVDTYCICSSIVFSISLFFVTQPKSLCRLLQIIQKHSNAWGIIVVKILFISNGSLVIFKMKELVSLANTIDTQIDFHVMIYYPISAFMFQ